MSRVFLLLTVLCTLLVLSSGQTFCETYSGSSTNATIQAGLITAVVVRAVTGGNYTVSSTSPNITVAGLFDPAGPLYGLFTGQIKYRVGAPNYVNDTTQLGILAGKLVAYFGQLFGCNAPSYPAVSNYNMYTVHANMSINYAQMTYFDNALANTLLSFGVPLSVVQSTAAPALGLFNRCGAPIGSLSSTAPVQICGTSDCPLAGSANYSTCVQYYAYPTSSSGTVASTSTASSSSSSSSSGQQSSGAAHAYATGAGSVVMILAAVVASLVL